MAQEVELSAIRQGGAAAQAPPSSSAPANTAGSDGTRHHPAPASRAVAPAGASPYAASDDNLDDGPSMRDRVSAAAHHAHKVTGVSRQTMLAALTHTTREMSRSKFTYCVGMLSCLIVVVTSALMQTLLGQAPLIFLREAESNNGQYDVVITPGPWTEAAFLDYTQVADLLSADEFSYHTPRLDVRGSAYAPRSCLGGYANDPSPASPTLDPTSDNTWMYAMPYAPSLVYDAEERDAAFAAGVEYPWCDNSCLEYRCAEQQAAQLYLIDSEKERRMGLGRLWPEDYEPIPPGSALLRHDLAASLGAEAGETVFLQIPLASVLRHALRPLHGRGDNSSWTDATVFLNEVAMPVRVAGIFRDAGGKVPLSQGTAVVMEYGSFLEFVAPHLHPIMRPDPDAQDAADRANPRGDLYKYAEKVLFNLPPSYRLASYTDASYDNVQNAVVAFASRMLYLAGFTEVVTDVPLLDELRRRRFVSLYLGLVLDILLFTLAALSSILIYSLLMINVQARTFELAVRRMLGTTRVSVVFLLVVQALSYAVPAWVVGLLLSEWSAGLLMKQFEDLSGIPMEPGLTGSAVLLATVLVATIPLAASLGPIRAALGTSLRDALDVTRSKAPAVKISLERASDGSISWSVVVVGTMLSLFGFAIYYLIPLSLLSFNLGLFFNIFLWILLGMLAGATLLAMNLQTVLERATVYAWFFWEKPFMRQLTLKNLVAHRVRNRKTMVMYALSISFIVLINVAANLEVQTASFQVQQSNGVPLRVAFDGWWGTPPQPATVRALEAALQEDDIAPLVQSQAWVTAPLRDTMFWGGASELEFSNIGRVYSAGGTIQGVSATFKDTIFNDFYVPFAVNETTDLSVSEQVYTARGSQGAIAPGFFKDQIGVDIDQQMLHSFTPASGPVQRFRLRNEGMLSSMAFLEFSAQPGSGRDNVLVSIPTYMRLARGAVSRVSQLPVDSLLVQPVDGASDAELDKIERALQAAIATDGEWYVEDTRDRLEDLGVTMQVLDLLFAALSVVALFLCYFSLLASMVTNIHEQTKEIGVVRAVGLDGRRIVRLYVYEAFTLVFASSLLGVGIGTGIGWAFQQQRALFTQLPIAFFVPWGVVITVCIASVICALLSACAPARRLVHGNITTLLRTMT